MKIVVGLGNPGRQYAATRHNIGYDVIDALSVRLGWTTGPGEFDRLARTKFDGLVMDGTTARGSKLLLLKPTTFMNLSGRAVRAAMDFHQVAASDVLIVLDDLALPCGRLRLRAGGSSGGHNGLNDIQRVLGTDQYPRLRIGIDPPPPNVPGKAYVLGRFSPEQRQLIDPAIARACDAIVTWVEQGIEPAMNQFNRNE